MNLIARFEEVAENLFTGMFKKNNTSKLQPVELAKELVRTMHKNKQVSISQVYVPNVYRVFLHSGDWSPFASFGDAFLIELSKYLFAEGKKSNFTFLSKPSIELHCDDTVKPHEMFIEVDFDDSIEVLWDEDDEYEEDVEEVNAEVGWRDHTNIFQDEVPYHLLNSQLQSRKIAYGLEIIKGPDAGKNFPLEGDEYHIGRHAQCEIVLHDPEVSRRHLKLSRVGEEWLLDDLGSTNGTWLNGQRIAKQKLALGDRIELGQTVFMLRHQGLASGY
ncbi:FhaA domain-containing protein [Desulfitobacterium sp. THU1]|uniref:FhaA domain-containing protein n=1 Tax=Desulfitobacterium sp. THU1 TaxID=3138072 RepID=UPI0031202356